MKTPLDKELDKAYEAFSQDHEHLRENLMSSLAECSKEPKQPNKFDYVWSLIGSTFLKSRITKLAVAAVIILAVGLLLNYQGTEEEVNSAGVVENAKNPAELTTFATLSFAYRRGGMEEVEKICDKALTMAGPRPAEVSVQDLLEGF